MTNETLEQAGNGATVGSCTAAGREALEGGDFDAAAAHFRRASELAPEDASVLVDLGFVRLMNGDGTGARAALEQAAGLRPDDDGIRIALAQVYEALGEPDRAADVLAGVSPDALTPRVLSDQARLYVQTERWAEAEAAFRALPALDPASELLAQHGRSWCRIRRKDWRGALDVALGAARLDRYDLTTAFLAYAKDRLFANPPDAEAREAALGERLHAEMAEYAELFSGGGADLANGEDLRHDG